MITQSTPFTPSQLSTLIEAYFDGSSKSGAAQYVGIQRSDLNTASLPSSISSSPRQTIKQVKGTPFTIPAKFFGVHATTASLSALATSGAGAVRTRDQGMSWADACPKFLSGAGLTFTVGTSTVNWTAHGLTAANHGVWFWNTGGSNPTGVANYTYYYLTNVTANSFQLSATPNGAPVAMSGSASGTPYCFAVNRSVIDPAGTGKLTALVNTANAAGMDVLFDCSEVPASISKDGTVYNIPSANTFVTTWIRFLFGQFANKITHYEVWNEPNTPGYFNGTTAGAGNDLWSYAAWIKAAIAAAGSTALVVSPSWTSSASAAMGTWLGTDGGNSQIDIVGFHPYRGEAYLGFDTALVDAYMAMAATNAAGKPVWITEVGESFLTPELIWRGHLYAAAKGVARVFWYDYDMATGAQNGGAQNMQINTYPDCDSEYKAMIAACAGKTCDYVNRTGTTGGYIGTRVNGVSYLK